MLFDKFDLKDALAGLWRFKWIYCIGLILVFVFTSGSLYFVPQAQDNPPPKYEKNLQGSSASYTISPKAGVDYGVDYHFSTDNKDWISLSKNLAGYYKSLLTTDVCSHFVYDKICEKFSEEELLELEKFRLQTNNVKEESLNFNLLLNYVTVSVVPDTSVVSILAVSPDMEFSAAIASAYREYVEKELPKTGAPAAQITFLGGLDQLVDPETVESTPRMSNPSVKLVVAILGSTLLYCIAVFAYVLFFPVINRKSDFEVYEIPVVAEIPRKPKGGIKIGQ